MSREVCVGIDSDEEVFIRRRSPRQSPGRSQGRSPASREYIQHGTPQIYRRNMESGVPSYAVRDFGVDRMKNAAEALESAATSTYNAASRPFQMKDLPNEFLEEFEQPSFHDVPPNASFDEVMCVLASPPQPTASEKLDELRDEVAQIVNAAAIGEIANEERVSKKPAEPSPEPEDIYNIPPPPKNPKDVVAIIKRAQAIERLKAYEEALAATNAPKAAIKKGVKGTPVKKPASGTQKPALLQQKPPPGQEKLAAAVKKPAGLKGPPMFLKKGAPEQEKPSLRNKKPATELQKLFKKAAPEPQKTAFYRQKPMPKTAAASKLPTKGDAGKYGIKGIKKTAKPPGQHPPGYVPEEWAAAILRTRKLAGLKTTNPKLIAKPKLKTPVPPTVKSPVRTPSPVKPPEPPTFESVKKRAAEIRARTDIKTVKKALAEVDRMPKSITLDEDFDDFEVLEELYGARAAGSSVIIEDSPITLQDRIADIKKQLLLTPPQAEAQDKLNNFKALEQRLGAEAYSQEPQAIITNIEERIETLQQKFLESPTPTFEVPSILCYQDLLARRESLAAVAAQAGLMQSVQEEAIGGEDDDEAEFEDDFWKIPISSVPSTDKQLISRPLTPLPDRSMPLEAQKCPITSHTLVSQTPTTQPFAYRADPRIGSPSRFQTTLRSKGFDDVFLENIDVPNFSLSDIPDFGVSEEAHEDAGFHIGDESMPDFEADISFDAYGLEDVSSPELCELSISGTELALEPDFPLEIPPEEMDVAAIEQIVEQEPRQAGFLTAMVNAVVERVRNLFSPTKSKDGQIHEEDDDEFNLDTSLPNMFETTPQPQPEHSFPKQVAEREKSSDGLIIIPPHPKNAKDYKAIVKRAQAIQKKKAQEAAAAPPHPPPTKEKLRKREIQSTIPKRAPRPGKKSPLVKTRKGQEKLYPPGEYSPSAVKAVARARTLAGYKNVSDLLNPERVAKLANLKAAEQAEIAAIEALPPVERMRKKMELIKKLPVSDTILPRLSIEMLGTLEAIRSSLPAVKKKWRPARRYRADRRVKKKDRIFRKDFGRILVPTEKTQIKKGWRPIDVFSPIVEEPRTQQNLMKFSPLRPHEGRMRLQYLKEQAAKRAAETIRAAEEAQAAISETKISETLACHSSSESFRSPDRSPLIQLQSPSSARTEESIRERVITQIGPNGGEETIREEITETSTIENGEVRLSTRKETTKTDEFGNVTRHVQEGKGLSGEEEALTENLCDIEPPEFLDTSNIPAPGDSSIPTPAEIINRIRAQVQEKLENAIPDVKQPPTPPSPNFIGFPEDLPDEELFEIETPEFEMTPPRVSPQKTLSPYDRDTRMYAWGDRPPSPFSPPVVCLPTIKVTPLPPEPLQHVSPALKPKSPEQIVIPPHPKDPKDYVAIVKRAQAIYKLKKQEEELLPKSVVPPVKATAKTGRVPISRWVGPPPKDPKKKPRKKLVLKKRVPKVSPKQEVTHRTEDGEIPDEPPELPQAYRDAVARARLLRGFKNKTAALNSKVAAKLAAKKAAEEAEIAAFEALSEYEKIQKRMEKVRRIPTETRTIKPSADVLGTLAAIRANMPPIEEILRQSSSRPCPPPVVEEVPAVERPSPQTPLTICEAPFTPHAPIKIRSRSVSPSYTKARVDQCLSPQPILTPYTPNIPIPSMRQLAVQKFFEEQGLFDESILANEPTVQPHVSPRPDAIPGTFYYDPMLDFEVPKEDIVVDDYLLMPETPPKNMKEKIERLKRAQEQRTVSPKYSDVHITLTSPAARFSPVRLFSPSSAPCEVAASPEKEMLIDIDAAPVVVRQFRDLEDMPFDELEYEPEPSLADISLEKPLTPPPKPLDILTRIRSKYEQDFRRIAQTSPPKSPAMIQMPEELPEEELLELSPPSFTQTPPSTPPAREISPRVSLPMAWGEVRTPTQKTPTPRKPSPEKVPTLPPVIEDKIPTAVCAAEEGPIVIPPHPKDPKDYAAMIKRAQAIYKLKKQEQTKEIARAPLSIQAKRIDRVPISRCQGPPLRKSRKQMVQRIITQPAKETKKPSLPHPPLENEGEEREIPAEPPELPQVYRDAVSRARLLRGFKNKTAALNPRVAAKLAAEAAAAAEFAALPEYEKIKVRMERLRKKPGRRRASRPTMEQVAYLEALKQISTYQRTPSPSSTQYCLSPITPKIPLQRQLSLSPRPDLTQKRDIEAKELAEFEELEQVEMPQICPSAPAEKNLILKQRVADLEKLLEIDSFPEMGDVSLAEFEALEAVEAPPVFPLQPEVSALDMERMISNLQKQQLGTPPRIDPKERYRQLLAQRQATPPSPVLSPTKTPEIHYSPVRLDSPSRDEKMKRAEKSTTQITRRGDRTIEERVTETSEIVNGDLQRLTTHVTTTTDSQGNVTCEVNESKRVSARDRSAEFEDLEDLEDIEEPSILDMTPTTPIDRPRPRDLIEKIRKQEERKYHPVCPTGRLIELVTPPPILPLPKDITQEQLLDFSLSEMEKTPAHTSLNSPVITPSRSPVRALDISIPHMFEATPPPVTPPLAPVLPLRDRIPSPEGHIVIPPHPKNPKDYKAICRRARLIQQLRAQEEAEFCAVQDAFVAAEAVKPKKKERVPISRWTAPPPRKLGKRKKLVMKKRGEDAAVPKAPGKKEKRPLQPLMVEEVEYAKEAPPLPHNYAEAVARARILAGLKNRTAALNPKVAAKEAAITEAARKAQEAENTKLSGLNVPLLSPIKDYETVLSRMAAMKEKGLVPRAQLSLASTAYLNALKSALQNQQQGHQVSPSEGGATYEPPQARYRRIMAERAMVPQPIAETPVKTPAREDIHYSPVRFVSPRAEGEPINIPESVGDQRFSIPDLENIQYLEELYEIEEPSFVDVNQYELGQDEYISITPPPTPPPKPAEIIRRLQEGLQEQQTIVSPEPTLFTPAQLEFPEQLPEEELFEMTIPSFSQSPQRIQTPIRSPNISLPRYFESTPPPRVATPPIRSVTPEATPPLLGICPGVRVRTPEGPISIPPHPKDPTDVAAMIRRAQLIQKLKAKEAAAAKLTKVRVPLTGRTIPATSTRTRPDPKKKGRLFRRLILKKKPTVEKPKALTPTSPRICPTEPPELPVDYIAGVDEARKLVGIKSRTLAAESKPTPPPLDYESVMRKVAALRAAKAQMQKGLTARELTIRQHLKNRQQRRERRRLLQELKRLRAQPGYQEQIELKTPPPVRERLQAIKESMPTETPKFNQCPYSPVKTPEVFEVPQYRPIELPPSPPCQFLQNEYVPEIADISMQFEEYADYEIDVDEADIEEYEFQVAESKAALSQSQLDSERENLVGQTEAQAEFDMAQRIHMLQQQLEDQETNQEHLEAEAQKLEAIQTDSDRGNRIEILESILLQPATQEEYNMAQRIQTLQQQLQQSPSREQKHIAEEQYLCPQMCQYVEDEDEQYGQANLNYIMDDFEEMERKCM